MARDGLLKKAPAAGEKKRARAKKSETPKKRRRRKSSWDYEDNDSDAEFEASAAADESDEEEEEPKPQPKKKRGRTRKAPEEKKQEKKDEEKKGPVRRKKKEELTAAPRDEDAAQDRAALEEKHRSRKRQYELDSEQLLNEVRDLALAEKRTQEKLIEKLKRDVTTLSRQAEEERKRRQKEVDRIVAEKVREIEAQQRSRDDADAEKAALREHIKELESQFASFKRSTGPDDVVTVNAAAASASAAMQNSEAILQLGQANKLLEIYRLVTSTDIRLIQSTDDDDQEGDDCTDIVCTTKDSATGNQFEFELAIPAIASSEIEYLPSDNPATSIHVPSYLREELSFNRSEMTKFIRSVLDVVIRKKKA
ncbi:N-acetylglucosamine-1-phosphotransferase subunits alpha/beta [Phytophthora cinnamomi]|uniref:N-acetylglucosamine-1-phosphotransferase subunits alpha/beta n=1 Tax=Phytophthora cinnamomi TaxID=4785 RepID=UPI00355A185A|nr:N-acetylglucosamine-1-phosphotransferase subunits alpha/beta [Phytophthora cinnamomi]